MEETVLVLMIQRPEVEVVTMVQPQTKALFQFKAIIRHLQLVAHPLFLVTADAMQSKKMQKPILGAIQIILVVRTTILERSSKTQV